MFKELFIPFAAFLTVIGLLFYVGVANLGEQQQAFTKVCEAKGGTAAYNGREMVCL